MRDRDRRGKQNKMRREKLVQGTDKAKLKKSMSIISMIAKVDNEGNNF